MRNLVCLTLGILLAGCAGRSFQKLPSSGPTLTRTVVLPGLRGTRPDVGVPGRIDHGAYDPVTGRLFIAALENGSLAVLDLEKGARVGNVTQLSRPQGAAVVPSLACVVVACGGDGSVHVFDTRTLTETKSFILGQDADNVRYDATHDTILISYGGTNQGAIAVFDPHTWTKLREFSFASRPESFQLDPAGNRLFANLPKGVRAVEDGAVAVVNLQDGTPLAHIQLQGRARNFPMAFDAAHERLFIASRRPARLIEIDTRRYEIIGDAPCTDDADDLFYDAKRNQVLVVGGGYRPDLQTPESISPRSPAGGIGALDVFSLGPKGELRWSSTTPTAWHARTGLFVPARGSLYVFVSFHDEREAEIREYRAD